MKTFTDRSGRATFTFPLRNGRAVVPKENLQAQRAADDVHSTLSRVRELAGSFKAADNRTGDQDRAPGSFLKEHTLGQNGWFPIQHKERATWNSTSPSRNAYQSLKELEVHDQSSGDRLSFRRSKNGDVSIDLREGDRHLSLKLDPSRNSVQIDNGTYL